MVLLACVILFVVVAGMTLLYGYRRYVLPGRIYENVAPGKRSRDVSSGQNSGGIAGVAAAVGEKVRASDQTASALQSKLISAGYRDSSAVTVLYGLKLIAMTAIGLTMFLLELQSSQAPAMRMLGILVGVFAGFRVPDYILAKKITRRLLLLRRGLPDALDLMIVCSEAGLTIDRTFRNVTQQLAIVHPDLCDELNVVMMEITAGLRRREALENLTLRTQEPEIRKFVAVISQADRFGTSMAEALRTHADYLRVRRRHDAEERASKIGVKLIFPIFLFIMPCMLLVTIGPAAFVIAKKLLPALRGTL